MILALDKSGKLTTAKGRPAYKRRTAGEMNDTEAAYAVHLHMLYLSGDIKDYSGFEPLTLKSGRRLYTPDFQVTMSDGSVKLVDVKGCKLTRVKRIPRPWVERQDHIRLEMFARAFPQYQFVLTWRHRGEWHEEVIAGEPERAGVAG